MLLLDAADLLRQVPGDRLAFAIGVGRQVDDVDGLRRLLDLGDDLALAADDHVLGREVVLDVDAHLRLRQIHDVADRRLHGEAGAEVLLDGLGLGRRLDDDQRRLAAPPLRRLSARLLPASRGFRLDGLPASRRRRLLLWQGLGGRLLLGRFATAPISKSYEPKVTPARGARGQTTQLQVHYHRCAGADRQPGAKRELTDVARHVVEHRVKLGRERILGRRRRRRRAPVEHGQHVGGVGHGDGAPSRMSASAPVRAGHRRHRAAEPLHRRARCARCPRPAAPRRPRPRRRGRR